MAEETDSLENTDLANSPIEVDERLRDPRHLKLNEIDENPKSERVSQYMADMYNLDNDLFSFDK